MESPTDRLSKAFEFARQSHAGQLRKGTQIAYLSHPMAVAAIVFEHGGSEDQVIAALLHDVMEDCGVTRERLESEFGPAVALMVAECTDATTTPKPEWKPRKEKYLLHLRDEVNIPTLLVSAADKLHNATCIVRDVKAVRDPEPVWRRFSATKKEVAWYYESLVAAYRFRLEGIAEPSPGFLQVLEALTLAVDQLKART
jgi:GTP pyrophosphokinase